MPLSHTKREELEKKYLEIHRCINPDCDQNGCIPYQVAEDEWTADQCEYCFKMRFESADFFINKLNSALEEQKKELVEKIENCKKPVDLQANYSVVTDVENRAFNKGMSVAINIINNQ